MSICGQKGSSFAGKIPSGLKGNFALGLQDQPICKQSLPSSTQKGWARNKTSPELKHHTASSVHQVSVCHLSYQKRCCIFLVCVMLREKTHSQPGRGLGKSFALESLTGMTPSLREGKEETLLEVS